MSYDPIAHRDAERERDIHLVRDGGPGWDAYVKHKAKRLAKEDPGLHGDLPRAIDEATAARAAQPQENT